MQNNESFESIKMQSRSALKEAFVALCDKNFDKCMSLANEAKKLLPDDAELGYGKCHLLMGSVFQSEMRYDDAVEELRKALEICSRNMHKNQKFVALERMARDRIAEINVLRNVTYKFPRTTHVLNLGGDAVTRDDLMMSPLDVMKNFGNSAQVVIEEKVDGANLGIQLNENWEFSLFNRSHGVSCDLGGQWAGLRSWVENNKQDLIHVLEGPGKYILFGEWLALKHSIHYDKLPSYFIAFDIYDLCRGCFLSTSNRNARLCDTSIPVIQPVFVGQLSWVVPSHQEDFNKLDHVVKTLLERPSVYRNSGVLEGVYLKVDDETNGTIRCRAKLVRSDFIHGITKHWSTAMPVKNKLNFDYLIATSQATETGKFQSCQGETVKQSFCSKTGVRGSEETLCSDGETKSKTNATVAPGINKHGLEKYPSTPHLPFSPSIFDDDITLDPSKQLVSPLLCRNVVVTEKVDGGNCCLYQRHVFARTHSKEATHWSFGRVKEMYHNVWIHQLQEKYHHVALFGENCTAVHSIDYGTLTNFFYLFSAFDMHRNIWLSWAEVEEIAGMLAVSTVPVVFQGQFRTWDEMQRYLESQSKLPSRASTDRQCTPEGFVIRVENSFMAKDFDSKIAKWVRPNHVQTPPDWLQTCKKSKVQSV